MKDTRRGKVPVCRLLCDEYAAIAGGASPVERGDGFPVIARNLPMFRGYGIKLWTVRQDLGQRAIYGDAFESFLGNRWRCPSVRPAGCHYGKISVGSIRPDDATIPIGHDVDRRQSRPWTWTPRTRDRFQLAAFAECLSGSEFDIPALLGRSNLRLGCGFEGDLSAMIALRSAP